MEEMKPKESQAILRAKLTELLYNFGRCSVFCEDVSEVMKYVPPWNKFQTRTNAEISHTVSNIAYNPIIMAAPTDYSTIYSTLLRIKECMNALGQTYAPIWCKGEELQDVIPCEGGMHTLMSLFAGIGYVYGDAGLRHLPTDSGVYVATTASNILAGKDFDRAMMAFKLIDEALHTRFLSNFEAWCIENKKEIHDDVYALLAEVRNMDDLGDMDSFIQRWCVKAMQHIMPLLDEFRAECRMKSPTLNIIIEHVYSDGFGVFSAYTDINVLQYYMSLEQPDDRVMCEYIWIDGTGAGLRCKCRTLEFEPKKPEDCPVWMFDGTDTYMTSEALNSDMYIYPRAIFRDPFKRGKNKLVLCEVFKYNMEPAETNNRLTCAKVMELAKESRPWFGIEQEYTLLDFDGYPSGRQKNGDTGPQGAYYLGVGTNKVCGRNIAESHYKACLYAGVNIAGCNSDILPGQWEFQVGPCEGIEMGDHLWIGRYLLLRIAEDFGVNVTFDPKPWEGVLVKATAQCNYSTLAMREKGGMKAIEAAIEKLSKTHVKHIQAYALKKDKDNSGGLTELHDTSNIHGFSAGIADRCATIRIPRMVADDGLGYIEDRRPPANCDPYTVTEVIVQTTVLDE